jgi:hypothetical protein
MYALCYKKFLLYAITGLSKQDHVLAEPPHRGSVDSVQQIICPHIKDIKMSWWQSSLFASKTHTYNVLWIFNDHPPSSHQEEWFLILFARFSTHIVLFQSSTLLKTSSGFLLIKVFTLTQPSSHWWTNSLAQSATLRGRMCCYTQSRSIHKNSDSHSFPVRESTPAFKKDPRSYPLKISSGFKIVSFVELAFQSV